MTDNAYLNQLLKDKINESSEIELHLFEYCNLSCSFCGQDHKNKEGLNTIVQKAQQVIDFIAASPMQSHIINVMGGEIFNDELGMDVYEDYKSFWQHIDAYCQENKQTYRVNFVTNLIFSRETLQKVKWLLEQTRNTFLSTSYDFAGRGLDINRMLAFKFNLDFFKDKVGVVGFVLTRPSIRKLIADKDKYFKEVLYRHYPLYFDWYVPENAADKMLPSEQEMLDAFLYIAKHYPKIEPVAGMLSNEINQMTCYSLNKVTILPSGQEVTCRYMDYDKNDFVHEIDYSSNANIVQAHLERNDCLSCEYYQRCQFRCFVQADWSKLERLPQCFIKTFFEKTLS